MWRTLAPAAAVSIVALVAWGQEPTAEAPPIADRYETRAIHDPHGIGKFYMGREIARVMGHEGADWLDRPERVKEEAPALLLELLRLRPGMAVADIGAGTGYHSLPIARKVGPAGKVYAVDIQPEMLQIIEMRAKAKNIANIELVRGEADDPKLPDESVDLALLVDVYHEFDHPYEMIRAITKALRPGGKIVFVEFRLEDDKVPIKRVHKMSQAQVKKEMSVQPLIWKSTIDALPWQHVIVFEKAPREPAREKSPQPAR